MVRIRGASPKVIERGACVWGHILCCELPDLYSSSETFLQFTKQDVTTLSVTNSSVVGDIHKIIIPSCQTENMKDERRDVGSEAT